MTLGSFGWLELIFTPTQYSYLKNKMPKESCQKSIGYYFVKHPSADELFTLKTFQKFLKRKTALSFLTRHKYFLMLESGKVYPLNFSINFSNIESTVLIYYVPLKTWVRLTSCTGGWFKSGFITKEFSNLEKTAPCSVFLFRNKRTSTSFTIRSTI